MGDGEHTAVSICSQSGWVGEETRMKKAMMPAPCLRAFACRVVHRLAWGEEIVMTHQPHPASQATACEVVGGWNDKGVMTGGDEREEVGGNNTCHMKHLLMTIVAIQ
jgi:hypothetical protein